MTISVPGGVRSKNMVLAAMIFAVSMTFIDQTIVSIAAPNIQKELGLTNTGLQWAINAYLLSLAALFAFGGRLADTVGHRKMVVIGVIVFAGASALCGLTPKGSVAEAWIVTFRAVQGAGGAIMFPAALAIVVQTFELQRPGQGPGAVLRHRRRAHRVGPVLGGYLTEWTWRAIFWVNIPVAVIALMLIAISRPTTVYRPAPHGLSGSGPDRRRRGPQRVRLPAVAPSGAGPTPAIGALHRGRCPPADCFLLVELRTASPLMQVRIFRIRAFAVENLVLGITMLVFVPVFFFASEYAQIALGKSRAPGRSLPAVFLPGFVVASQIGGRMLDRRGAKRPVVVGCALSAVGFYLWAGKVTQLNFSTQVWSSSSLGPAWASCSPPPAPTRSTGRPGSPTARPPASPRRFATTPPAWVSPSSAPSWSRSFALGVTRPRLSLGVPAGRACRRPTTSARPRAQRQRRFPTSSASILPTPPARCFTSWPGSWRRRQWWPWWAWSGGCSRTSRARFRALQHGRSLMTPTEICRFSLGVR